MKPAFATTWNRSEQRRKQRKYAHNAPYHVKGRFLSAHLSEELKKKHGKRSARLREGDKVKVLRGSNKGKEAKVEKVDLKRTKVYLLKVERTKPDGNKVQQAFHPSNLMITELNLDDKKRKAKLERQAQGAKR
ncbi:50S ribosomal protein L24 [Candidatus Woesearchaeota archaeon]|nr:50S ribosomal protein L24 [Candidatus Woesearchaeota archaeon]